MCHHFAFVVHRKTVLNVMFEGVYISTQFYFSREVIPCFWPKIGNGFLAKASLSKGKVQFKCGHTCIVSGVRWVKSFRNVLRRHFIEEF